MDDSVPSGAVVESGKTYEQQSLLAYEEKEWHKSVYKPLKPEENTPPKERPWLEPVTMDDRIASRMSTFELAPEDEARAREIEQGKYGDVDQRSLVQRGREWLWRVGVFMDLVEVKDERGRRGMEQGLVGGEDE